MSQRITDSELRFVEKVAEKVDQMHLRTPREAPTAKHGPEYVLALNAHLLVAEIRRLRGLILILVDPDPRLRVQCPRCEGRCRWCAADIGGLPPAPHVTGCPWLELEHEAQAAAKERA
jgi:hypothetical protein